MGEKKSRLIMKSWRSSFSVFWKRMLEERVSSKNCLSLWSRDSQRLNLALFFMSNKAWKLMNCIWGEKRSSAEQSFLYFCVIPGYQLQTSLLTRTDELSVQCSTALEEPAQKRKVKKGAFPFKEEKTFKMAIERPVMWSINLVRKYTL